MKRFVRFFFHIPALIALMLVLAWIGTADATPVTLRCNSLQGEIIFDYPFQSTSGGCSTGIFTGTYNDPMHGIVTAQVSNNGTTITHNHDVQDLGSTWLVSTEAFFQFTVSPDMESITLQASSSPTYEETLLMLDGPSGRFYFLGGGWQSPGSPPADTVPLGWNTLELLPGFYSGYYRFKTYTDSGHKVESVWLAVNATVVPEPTTALLVACGLVGLAVRGRRAS